MALFKKDPGESAAEAALTPPGEVRSTSAAPVRTYVAAGSHIEGSISGETEVLVDGSLVGCVELEGGSFSVAAAGSRAMSRHTRFRSPVR